MAARIVFRVFAVVVGATLLFAARTVRADDEMASCATVTARSAMAIFVPTTDAPGGPTAVSIVPGETLCLVEREDEDSSFRTQLVDPRHPETARIVVRLEATSEGETLHVATTEGLIMYAVFRTSELTGQTWFESSGEARTGNPQKLTIAGRGRLLLTELRHRDDFARERLPMTLEKAAPPQGQGLIAPSGCATVSAREPDAIVVPVTDDPNGPHGVTILPGETLCLAGHLDAAGHGFEPRLARSGASEPALVRLRRAPPGERDALYVLSSFPVHFAVTSIEGPVNFVRWRNAWASGDDGETRWPLPQPSAQRVLLYRFEGRSPRAGGSSRWTSYVQSTWADRSFELTITVPLVLREKSIYAFDDALRASGYGPLSRSFVGAGYSFEVAVQRWHFQATADFTFGGSSAANGGSHVGATLTELFLRAGYDFLRWRGLTGFVLAGFGGAELDLDAYAPGWDDRGFSRSAMLGSSDSFTDQAALASLQAGFEQRVTRLGNEVGAGVFALLQAGYDRQIGSGGWTVEGSPRSLSGLPSIDLGGAWMSLSVALGIGSVPPPRSEFSPTPVPPDPHPVHIETVGSAE